MSKVELMSKVEWRLQPAGFEASTKVRFSSFLRASSFGIHRACPSPQLAGKHRVL